MHRRGAHHDSAVDLGGLQVAAAVEGARQLLHDVDKDLVSAPAVRARRVQHRLYDSGRAFGEQCRPAPRRLVRLSMQ
jgi:hypothetical protein